MHVQVNRWSCPLITLFLGPPKQPVAWGQDRSWTGEGRVSPRVVPVQYQGKQQQTVPRVPPRVAPKPNNGRGMGILPVLSSGQKNWRGFGFLPGLGCGATTDGVRGFPQGWAAGNEGPGPGFLWSPGVALKIAMTHRVWGLSHHTVGYVQPRGGLVGQVQVAVPVGRGQEGSACAARP